jgi:organic radical activating enzyme
MTDIESMLEQTRRDDADFRVEIMAYLLGFQHIILRGAGNFGAALGSFLLKTGVDKSKVRYWDVRASELHEVNGIPVEIPFTGKLDNNHSIFINCIPNGSLSEGGGERDIRNAKFVHRISGMALFEALMCPTNSASGLDAEVCLDATFCNWCACKRLPSLVQKRGRKNHVAEALVFPVATFVINQKCTLRCRHCGQYINHYRTEDRINFGFERIKQDMDRFFDAVDAIGFVSVIGGEPFLHPQLSRIIEHIWSKPNFGVLGVTTNGVCDISAQHLATLAKGPGRIIFSDYTVSLNDKQKKLFHANVKKVAASGINYTVGQPLWGMPSSLIKQNHSDEVRKKMKSACDLTATCKTIQNGVYYPCSITTGIGTLGLADYKNDKIILDETASAVELREKIRSVDNLPFYQSCAHCGTEGELLQHPGEQGIDLRYLHIGGQ